MTGYEIRVSYRREGWAPDSDPTVRTYNQPARAAALVRRLLDAKSRPDLSPITDLTIDRRPVGAWERLTINDINGDK